jgi:hypothetical protein
MGAATPAHIRRTGTDSRMGSDRVAGDRVVGAQMGNRLEAAGKTGVIGNAIYSGWGHGLPLITPFHNIAGMLTESASARLATPINIHPDSARRPRPAR